MDSLMINTPPGGGKPATMTSQEMAELVDKRHDNVKRAIETLASQGTIQRPQIEDVRNHRGQLVAVYLMGERDSYVVVAQLSPEFTASLVDYWQAHKTQVRLPTTAEAFANAFQMLAETERRQEQQDAAIQAIDVKVDRIEQAQVVLKTRPANAESITHIRPRIGKLYGLSHETTDAVMRNTSYAPRPAGMVRNDREEADGATFAVYWKKDVSAVFKRFVDECEQVTATRCTHPFIDGRFKLIKTPTE
ncbi:Rha family transcriptional regulator [Phyllobacterium sp. OV277]|uniref:Rha family transcriptional regulator n=1 Tax=Phyllobacterium sp. OV277 TaxID=1882772 RepID=UPI0008883FDE|nr:Rha family transcriptional regulator [Phyllobacterium sp. OV277]SDP09343.1 Phage regulatory protein Rha (Phage_pRha) [Phyllobacterium sp. OV277]